MINSIIVDDEQHAIDVLAFHIKQIPSLNLVFTTCNPIEALDFLNSNQVQLIFLDIQMSGINGIDLAKAIQHKKIKIVFCTAYSEFALDGYELNVVDYLLKPISFARVLQATQKASELIYNETAKYLVEEPKTNYFFIKKEQKGKLQRIDYDQIDYIESRRNYVAIFCNNQNNMVLSTMKELEEKLPPNKFIRIHKSIIVCLEKITGLQSNFVILDNYKAPLPIGDSYKDALREAVNKNLL